MELNQHEEDVLTLVHDVPVEKFLDYCKKFVNYDKEEIKGIIKKLINEKLIRIVKIPVGKSKVELYLHTRNFPADMLNDDLRYQKDMGD